MQPDVDDPDRAPEEFPGPIDAQTADLRNNRDDEQLERTPAVWPTLCPSWRADALERSTGGRCARGFLLVGRDRRGSRPEPARPLAQSAGQRARANRLVRRDFMRALSIWANDKAKADARKGGTDPLVGLDLLREIRVRDSDSWRVRLFLPEQRRSVAGTIVMIDDDRFRARSCVLGVVCRA